MDLRRVLLVLELWLAITIYPPIVRADPAIVAGPQEITAEINSKYAPCKGNISKIPSISVPPSLASLVLAEANQQKTSSANSLLRSATKKSFRLTVANSLQTSLQDWAACKTPFVVGTLDTLQLAHGAAAKNPALKMRIIHQFDWSRGDHALTTRTNNLSNIAELAGAKVALSPYTSQVYFLARILSDAGMAIKDLEPVWTANPSESSLAFRASVPNAVLAYPENKIITDGYRRGLGHRNSIILAKPILTTLTMRYAITHVLAVREDFYQANKNTIAKMLPAIMVAQNRVAQLLRRSPGEPEFKNLLLKAAQAFFGNDKTIHFANPIGSYDLVSAEEAERFLTNKDYPRNVSYLEADIDRSLRVVYNPYPQNSPKFLTIPPTKPATYPGYLNPGPFANPDQLHNIVEDFRRKNLPENRAISIKFLEPLTDAQLAQIIDILETYHGGVLSLAGYTAIDKLPTSNAIEYFNTEQRLRNRGLINAVKWRQAALDYGRAHKQILSPMQLVVRGSAQSYKHHPLCLPESCPRDQIIGTSWLELQIHQMAWHKSLGLFQMY